MQTKHFYQNIEEVSIFDGTNKENIFYQDYWACSSLSSHRWSFKSFKVLFQTKALINLTDFSFRVPDFRRMTEK